MKIHIPLFKLTYVPYVFLKPPQLLSGHTSHTDKCTSHLPFPTPQQPTHATGNLRLVRFVGRARAANQQQQFQHSGGRKSIVYQCLLLWCTWTDRRTTCWRLIADALRTEKGRSGEVFVGLVSKGAQLITIIR